MATPVAGSHSGSVSVGTPCFTLSWMSKLEHSAGLRHRNRLQGDIEQEELHYANSQSLSSYYSVFVVRVSIMVLLAVLIGLLTILTWHFTKVYTTKSLDSLANGLRYELLQRPLLRMWGVLNSTVEITTAQVKLSEYVIKKYTSKPATQSEQVELYEMMWGVTWALFSTHGALNAITISYKNGFVQAFHRDHRNNNTFFIYSDLANYSISGSYALDSFSSHQRWNDLSVHGNLSAIWYREPLDPISGERTGKPVQIPPDEMINIAGPSQVPDGVASWHVSVSKYTQSPSLSAALPVWDTSNKTIVAVVGVTTALYSVGELMKDLVEFHGGHIYLTSQQGYLLATSTNAPLLKNSTSGPKLVKATESEDDVIREGAKWLEDAYPDKFPSTHEVHIENAKIRHQRCYVDSFYLNLKRLPMVGVVIIPREYIMGKVDQRAFKTLVILISASLCILVIGCICIFILTSGVSKEMDLRAELISQLEARRRAEASSNYKSQFLANMSHELRTPMAAVIGLLDILVGDDGLSNEQFSMITQIRKCSTALLHLLNNILDLSKVESGKLVLEEADFNLGRELEGLIDMFSVQCINHNVEVILDLSDNMPKLVKGDSARVVQIFANLISNSIKFTTSGHIILRGWCENSHTSTDALVTQNWTLRPKQQGQHVRKKAFRRDNKVTIWFEVDDTGCGIDKSKWESVFESFEQADTSTTRKHGGTGLGLCIVRTLVNKMGGEIKVVEKNGQGALMRFCLLLKPSVVSATQQSQTKFLDRKLVVMLALGGNIGRAIMLEWLQKIGFSTWQAGDWNELAQILKEIFQAKWSTKADNLHTRSRYSTLKDTILGFDVENSAFLIVVDVSLLDLNTNIWREQLNFLEKYSNHVKFAWVLNHDTSNSVKMELRRKGHDLIVNKPLYKTKMTQILDDFTLQRHDEVQKMDSHECLEINSIHYDEASSDDSDKLELRCVCPEKRLQLNDENKKRTDNLSYSGCSTMTGLADECCEGVSLYPRRKQRGSFGAGEQELTSFSLRDNNLQCHMNGNGERSLEGIRILLAEDMPILQRVATIMLEKMGARVTAVGDGQQAVNVLKCPINDEGQEVSKLSQYDGSSEQIQIWNFMPFDLVLMDCQMPKMDGYEATKAIRDSEIGTEYHIPIVALTAHAMSSDEAKCLEVGMDAYLTKPIDCKLMVSTILSLTSKRGRAA